MIRLPQALVAVMAGTLASGLAGGIVGAAVGRLAPSFVAWLQSPLPFNDMAAPANPVEFGLGLGIVCGLFLGAGASLFLTMLLVIRDAYLANRGLIDPRKDKPQARELVD